MTIQKKTTLTCNYCKKEASFIGDRPKLPGPFIIDGFIPPEPPSGWHKILPNVTQSIWTGAEYKACGDFCSLECMRDKILAVIEERDNPKETI